MGAKKAEAELGSFDCVHSESGKAPSVGKLSVFKTSLVFKSQTFGLGEATAISVKRKDLDALDATSSLTLKIQHKKTRVLELQFAKSRAPFALISDQWRLKPTDRDGFAVKPEKSGAGDGEKTRRKDYDLASPAGAVEYAKDLCVETYEKYNAKLKDALVTASRLGGVPIPPTPKLPTIDCEDVVSKCLFVKVKSAVDLLAMDGDTSDPFVVVRYRGSEALSTTKPETLNPTWDEVFTFRTPPGRDELDETDEVELFVYDRDFGGLNDFIGYARVDLRGVAITTSADAARAYYSPEAWNQSDDETRKRREWLDLGPMPKEEEVSFFDANHLKEKLMFWEGERAFTGRVEVETWMGNRHDHEFRVAGVPAVKTVDEDAEKNVAHYVDPVTALIRVEVKRGRNVMDLDGDGGSDPYCEVALVDPKGVKPEQSQSTHYIDDTMTPEWDRTFNFILAKPYEDELVLRVYDYDGATSFDDLIGQVKIPVSKLKVDSSRRKATAKSASTTKGSKGVSEEGTVVGDAASSYSPPAEEWMTLLDKEGNEKDAEGTPYGEILVKAYLDEEYFEHLHGGDAKGEVGKLAVDVVRVLDLPKPTTTFCVVKIGPYWTRLPNVDESAEPRWNQRLLYPVFEPAACVTVAVFEGAAGSCQFLGRVKLQLSTMEDGVRYAGTFQLIHREPASGEVRRTCRLECGIRFDYGPGGKAIAAKYMEPMLPEKWYTNPMADEEKEKVIKAHKEMLVQRLAIASPPLSDAVSKQLLEFAKHEVNVGSIKSSIARIQRLVAGVDKITAAIAYALSWDSVVITALAQAWIVYLVYYPNMLAPSVLLAIALYSLALFPGRYQRVLERMEADEWLSQGLPFAPESEEEERMRKEREEKRRKEEEEEAKRLEEERKELESLNAEERAAREEQEKIVAEKRKAAEAAAAAKAEAEKPKEAFSWESLNPLAALQKQMDEVFAMITMSQTILDEAAGAAERLAGVLSWEEPRVTAGFVMLLLIGSWALIYVEIVTRFFVKFVLGVVVKTVFKIISPAAMKFGVSAGILFAMRHPAILPDEKTKAVQEAKERARKERERAKELAESGDEADEAAAPPPPPPAPPTPPLAPLNVFFRMPTQSERIL